MKITSTGIVWRGAFSVFHWFRGNVVDKVIGEPMSFLRISWIFLVESSMFEEIPDFFKEIDQFFVNF